MSDRDMEERVDKSRQPQFYFDFHGAGGVVLHSRILRSVATGPARMAAVEIAAGGFLDVGSSRWRARWRASTGSVSAEPRYETISQALRWRGLRVAFAPPTQFGRWTMLDGATCRCRALDAVNNFGVSDG